MQTITSSDNQKIKHFKKLQTDKKARYAAGEFVVEGHRWVRDALQFYPEHAANVFIKESLTDAFLSTLSTLPPFDDSKVWIVSDNIFDKISETKHTQGMAAVLKMPQKNTESVLGRRVLYLDSIRDPGNIGTIIRTAAAGGFKDIVLDGCADPYNPKVVRSTMGALFRVNLWNEESLPRIQDFKKRGYSVLAATLAGENIFTYTKNHDKMVLMIGSEAEGLCHELIELADSKISIPMLNGVESLNAAVSAALLMYWFTKPV